MKTKRGKPNDESSRKKRKKIELETRKHITWDYVGEDTLSYIDFNHPNFQNTALKQIIEYKLDFYTKTTFAKSTLMWTIPFFNDDLNNLIKETMEHHALIDFSDSNEERRSSIMRFYDKLQTDILSVISRNAEYTSDEQPIEKSKHIIHVKLEQE